ncbi:hypothetical protein EUTSA_v10005251mg [Eutrema salsugineum]|uniref:HSF-type DNA-binding domain-containing protein n=1 Tax=Eutrema salsugineum TaxID=72664 RepID=V4KNS5_EUTSA|nr:hypothetical protein EUTSA_v10005251mg [Eutrema salsugineum]
MAGLSDRALSPFYKALYMFVDDPSMDSIVSWSKSNRSFIIWDPVGFHTRILSRSIGICEI